LEQPCGSGAIPIIESREGAIRLPINVRFEVQDGECRSAKGAEQQTNRLGRELLSPDGVVFYELVALSGEAAPRQHLRLARTGYTGSVSWILEQISDPDSGRESVWVRA